MKQEEIDKMFEGRWRIKSTDFMDLDVTLLHRIKDLCRDFFEVGIALGNDDYSVQMENPIPSVQELKPIEDTY